MAFTARASGNLVRAADITELQDALQGTSGAGQAIALTALNSSSSYALTVRNLHTTSGYTALFEDENNYTILGLTHHTVTVGHTSTQVKVVHTAGSHTVAATMHAMTATWTTGVAYTALSVAVTNTSSDATSALLSLKAGAAGATDVFSVLATGKVFINDSANANMAQGLTINQGANDDEILALKGSDVAHGVTTLAETDTFFLVKKAHATNNSTELRAINQDGAWALVLSGYADDGDVTKGATSTAPVMVYSAQHSGTGIANMDADANVFVVRIYRGGADTTVFVVDEDGDIHCDAGGSYGGSVISGATVLGYNTYDEFEDAELVRTLDVERSGRGLVRQEFDHFLRYNRQDLERLKVATFNPDSTFINYTALVRLHSGAIWQLHRKLQETLERLATTEQQLRLALGIGPSLEAAR